MDAHAAQCRPRVASQDRSVQPRDADAAQCHPRSAKGIQNPSNAFEHFRGFCGSGTCPPLSAPLRGCVGGWACRGRYGNTWQPPGLPLFPPASSSSCSPPCISEGAWATGPENRRARTPRTAGDRAQEPAGDRTQGPAGGFHTLAGGSVTSLRRRRVGDRTREPVGMQPQNIRWAPIPPNTTPIPSPHNSQYPSE